MDEQFSRFLIVLMLALVLVLQASSCSEIDRLEDQIRDLKFEVNRP